MHALPPVARFLKQNRKYILDRLTTIIVTSTGVSYYIGNKLHREDGPAVECYNGTKEWYRNRKLHRDNDMPAVERNDGSKHWYQNGKLHRDGDMPAIENINSDKFWYHDNMLHREDGPAIIYADGSVEYWVNDMLRA